jgi:hypothetical protein
LVGKLHFPNSTLSTNCDIFSQTRNIDYDLAAQGLPVSYRKMLEAKRQRQGSDTNLTNDYPVPNAPPGLPHPPAPPYGCDENWMGHGPPPVAAPAPCHAASGPPATTAQHVTTQAPAPAYSGPIVALRNFPIAELDQPPHMYPKIETILLSLDTNAGGSRYGEYLEVFTKGLYVNTIGEFLFWLHDEVNNSKSSPTAIVVKEITQVLDFGNPLNQHQRFSNPNIMVPTTILTSLMIHEFESAGIAYEQKKRAELNIDH